VKGERAKRRDRRDPQRTAEKGDQVEENEVFEKMIR
jgi:hypothetical protein